MRRIVRLGVVLALAVPLVGNTTARAAKPPILVWNPAADWRDAPDQSNPSPDSYGNPDVWSYLESTGPDHDPDTFELLPDYSSAGEQWTDDAYLYLLVGHEHESTIRMHSYGGDVVGFSRNAILAWTSPVSGAVRILGDVALVDASCTELGSGIVWSIDEGAQTMFQEAIPSGGSTSFDLHVDVEAGDTLFFNHDPGWDSSCDTVFLTLNIGMPDVPETMSITSDTTLTDDHVGSIQIDSDDVTLDCAGYRVLGAGTGEGIRLDGRTGVTVENCEVRGFDSGIGLYGSSGNTFTDNVTVGNGFSGIYLESSDANTFTGNVARANGTGLGMHGSSENIFTRNRFVENGPDGWGVWVSDSSNANRFIENVARANAYEGIAMAFGVSGNVLTRNVSVANRAEGISMYFGADDNLVRANVTIANSNSGILVYESSHNAIIDNRAVLNNTAGLENGGGISLEAGASFNDVVGNIACRNGNTDGFDDHSGTGNTWRDNRFCTSDI